MTAQAQHGSLFASNTFCLHQLSVTRRGIEINHAFLTCAHQAEADTIATILLEKQLIACAKTLPVNATFLWQGSLDSAKEVLLLMDTVESTFNAVEQEVRKLHSYTTFVLTALEVKMASAGVADWIKTSLH